MNHFSVDQSLKNMVVYVDSREQKTVRAQKRLDAIGLPIERKALSFGDYSAYCILPNGSLLTLENDIAIERKMDLSEVAACYGSQRRRFIAEFERARKANAKLYLLVEKGSWEKVYAGEYRSKMSPASLSSSMLAWLARYNCQLLFCEPSTSGKLIHDILYREMKERLTELPDEEETISPYDYPQPAGLL